MNDTIVTVQGWLGSDPVIRKAGDTQVANFRVACTPRRLQRSTGEWVDGPTQWYGVSAWRQLAEHCGRSLKRGDPVLLQGRLNQGSYENRDGVRVTTMEIDLITIGHDLAKGVSMFQRAPRAEQRPGQPGQADPWATGTIAPPESEPDDEGEPAEQTEDRAVAA